MADHADIPTSMCPICGYVMDAATVADGGPPVVPKDGDMSVCLKCGTILIFVDGIHLRLATPDEVVACPDAAEVSEQVRRYVRSLPRKPGERGQSRGRA